MEVLNELPSFTQNCALLFGLIYALNLSYPSELIHTFGVLQKIFMYTEPSRTETQSESTECQPRNIGLIKERDCLYSDTFQDNGRGHC